MGAIIEKLHHEKSQEVKKTSEIVEEEITTEKEMKHTEIKPIFPPPPPTHYITRPMLVYPEYPVSLPGPMPYNHNQPHGPNPTYVDYDYNYGPVYPDYEYNIKPVHPVRFPDHEAQELFPM